METYIIKRANMRLEFQYIIFYIGSITFFKFLLQKRVSYSNTYINLQLRVPRKFKTDCIYVLLTWKWIFD
jgi:hypothetical protein